MGVRRVAGSAGRLQLALALVRSASRAASSSAAVAPRAAVPLMGLDSTARSLLSRRKRSGDEQHTAKPGLGAWKGPARRPGSREVMANLQSAEAVLQLFALSGGASLTQLGMRCSAAASRGVQAQVGSVRRRVHAAERAVERKRRRRGGAVHLRGDTNLPARCRRGADEVQARSHRVGRRTSYESPRRRASKTCAMSAWYMASGRAGTKPESGSLAGGGAGGGGVEEGGAAEAEAATTGGAASGAVGCGAAALMRRMACEVERIHASADSRPWR